MVSKSASLNSDELLYQSINNMGINLFEGREAGNFSSVFDQSKESHQKISHFLLAFFQKMKNVSSPGGTQFKLEGTDGEVIKTLYVDVYMSERVTSEMAKVVHYGAYNVDSKDYNNGKLSKRIAISFHNEMNIKVAHLAVDVIQRFREYPMAGI